MNRLQIPNSTFEIRDGTVVTLSGYPTIKWIVRYGWYVYEGAQYHGWYFSAIPDCTTLPVSEELLATATIVASSMRPCPPAPCPPGPCPPGPLPPGPCPPGPTAVSPAFISVQTLTDRNMLNAHGKFVPDGKLVRVNNVDGKVKYYVWDAYNSEWDETTIIETSDIINTSDDEKILSIDDHTISATLNLSTITEDDKTYIILSGVDDQEVSKLDITAFVTGGDVVDSVELVEHLVDDVPHPFIRINCTSDVGDPKYVETDVYALVSASSYYAAEGGGLVLDENTHEFAISNTVTANPTGVNVDTSITLGQPAQFKTVTYDSHGMITGEQTFNVTVSGLSGTVGSQDNSKVITYLSAEDGAVTGNTVDIVTDIDKDSTDAEISTAKAVYTTILKYMPVWQ